MSLPPGSDINDFFITESGRIESRFWRQARARGIWTNQIRQTKFPLGMGEILTKANYERSNPIGDGFQWTPLLLDNGTAVPGNNANPPTVEVDPAWSTFQFQLSYGAINSNEITVNDIALSLEGGKQVSLVLRNLQDYVLDVWENRKQDEYDRICGHKRLCIGKGPTVESGFNQAWPATPPDSQINIEFLEEDWDDLMRDGGAAGDWGSLEMVLGQPCPCVFISPEGQRAIFRQNIEHRKDLRYSSKSDWLLNPVAEKVPMIRNPSIQTGNAFGHFRYGINLRAPRYNFVNGSYVRVPYYSPFSATVGTAVQPSIAYKQAQFEVCYIFHPAVMELCTYDPDPSYDNGIKFDSTTFTGRFKWVNNKDMGTNIDGNWGIFRALLASASRPGLPNLGYARMYKRCANDRNALGCVNS